VLDPTIRKEGSQIVLSMNRDSEDAVIDKNFIQSDRLPPRTNVVNVNYVDNPYPIEQLKELAEHCKRVDFALYQHIWMGELNNLAKEQVLHGKWRTDVFNTPSDVTYYIGADYGMGGADPHTLVSCYIKDKVLYIDNEMMISSKISIDDLGEAWGNFPPLQNGEQWRIYADSAQALITREMQKKGFNVTSTVKNWHGTKSSVQAGINYLRSFDEIVIHERCRETIKEAKYWRWKVDKASGDIIPVLVEGSDHIWDAVRYSMVKLIMRGKWQ